MPRPTVSRAILLSVWFALAAGLSGLAGPPAWAEGNLVTGGAAADGAMSGGALPGGAGRLGLRTGWREPDGRHVAALVVTLAPGWKTYWRAPGDAGIPPVFDWSGSRNLAGVVVHWPRPVVFDQAGMTSIGYVDEMVLPLEVVPADPAAAIDLDAEVTLGVCRDICVPVTARFAARLVAPGAADPHIRAALAHAPAPLRGRVTCRITPIADGLRLEAMLPRGWAGDGSAATGAVDAVDAVAVEVSDPAVWVSQAELSQRGGRVAATADLVPPAGAPFALDRSSIRFTVIAGAVVAETAGCTAE